MTLTAAGRHPVVMPSRVELVRDLDQLVAARFGRRAVDRLKGQVESEARRRAPAAKVWTTAHDEQVRLSHRLTNGQTIPANLRFRLPKVVYVHKGRDPHGNALDPAGGWKLTEGHDLGRFPRDSDLPVHQTVNCRCQSVPLPGVVAASIHAGPTTVTAVRAHAEVSTRFPRAAESENGTSGDPAARFMSGAVAAVAARLRR